MRVVSLVPSTTETVAALGLGETLVGVTDYCTQGTPAGTPRLGGTKNPKTDEIVALRPDVVLVNTEENRAPDVEFLRAAGLAVHETFPRTVVEARDAVVELGELLGAQAPAARMAAEIDQALEQARDSAPAQRVVALTLIWRKPWMGVGPDTYADDLLWQCGFANALAGYDERYPRLEEGLLFGADVVLLPSEPYEFTPDDLGPLTRLAGHTPPEFVDGELLTWHGPRTAAGLRTFSDLAARLSA